MHVAVTAKVVSLESSLRAVVEDLLFSLMLLQIARAHHGHSIVHALLRYADSRGPCSSESGSLLRVVVGIGLEVSKDEARDVSGYGELGKGKVASEKLERLSGSGHRVNVIALSISGTTRAPSMRPSPLRISLCAAASPFSMVVKGLLSCDVLKNVRASTKLTSACVGARRLPHARVILEQRQCLIEPPADSSSPKIRSAERGRKPSLHRVWFRSLQERKEGKETGKMGITRTSRQKRLAAHALRMLQVSPWRCGIWVGS